MILNIPYICKSIRITHPNGSIESKRLKTLWAYMLPLEIKNVKRTPQTERYRTVNIAGAEITIMMRKRKYTLYNFLIF